MAPFADPDTIRVTGTDKFGNAISINFRVDLPFGSADTTPPNTPTLTASPPAYINTNSVSVEVNGEAGATVFVNGASTGSTVAGNGKVTVSLNTSGADGTKNFSITLKDADLNVSGAVSVSVLKGTVAPSSVSWANGGGYVPDTQGSSNSGMVLAGNMSFAGATGISVSSTAGGTVSGVSVNGSGQLAFNYVAPFADPDTIRVTGTDKFGNSISINFIVDLPF